MWFDEADLLLSAVGALLLLFGWALYWIALNTAGAVLFGAGFLVLCNWIGAHFEVTGGAQLALRLGGTVLGAVLGALFFQWVHKFAFFALGFAAGLGGAVAVVLGAREAGQDWAQSELVLWLGSPVAGVVLGLVATMLDKYVIAFLAATLGGVLLWEGLNWPGGMLPLLLVIPVGTLFQWGIARLHKDKDEDD